MTQHVAHRKSDEIAASIAAERKRCADICRGMVIALRMGAGSDYTAAERLIGITTAEWLAKEIESERRSDEDNREPEGR